MATAAVRGFLVFAAMAVLVIVTAAAPAFAATPQAGQFCKATEAGQTATAGNGRAVSCTTEAQGRYRWTYTSAAPPTTAATSGTVTANPTVASPAPTRAGLASTGLNHTAQLLEAAVVLLGLGSALVLEVGARERLARMRGE